VPSKYGIKHAHREAIMHRGYDDIEKQVVSPRYRGLLTKPVYCPSILCKNVFYPGLPTIQYYNSV